MCMFEVTEVRSVAGQAVQVSPTSRPLCWQQGGVPGGQGGQGQDPAEVSGGGGAGLPYLPIALQANWEEVT